MRDQIPVLNDTIDYQRKVIDELKLIIEDKNLSWDLLNRKYLSLIEEVGFLRQQMDDDIHQELMKRMMEEDIESDI